ncbi:hypothetical protein BHE74_00043857, partial [Ensete ventricosum]
EKIWCWSSTRSGLNRFETEENSREFDQEQRKTTESSVLYGAGFGEHERRSREVGSPALMLRRLPRRVCRGRGCRRGGSCVTAAVEEN